MTQPQTPAQRELRAYDLEPADVPEPYREDEPPSPLEHDGHVRHPLTDSTRAIGLDGLERARAALAQHTGRGHGNATDDRVRSRRFARQALEASARWHEQKKP